MRPVHASLFDITLQEGQPAAVVRDVAELVRAWVRDKYSREETRWGALAIEFSDDGVLRVPGDGHEISTALVEVPGGTLSTLYWKHPDQRDESLAWVSRVSVGALDTQVQFHCLVALGSRGVELRPVERSVGRPRVVSDLLHRYDISVGGWAVAKVPRLLQREEVSEFVTTVLCSSVRTLPIVVISPELVSERSVVDPGAVQADLRGVAEVVVLADKFAAFSLTDEVGKQLSCYDGAVRVYWPGLSLSDDGFDHPLYLGSTLRRIRESGKAWSREFAGWLNSMSVQAFARAPLLNRVRRLFVEEKARESRETIERARARTSEDHAFFAAWEADLDSLKAAEEKIELLEDQVEQLTLAAQWAKRGSEVASDAAPTPSGQRAFASVAEAVEAAAADFGKELVFLSTAHDSAADSPFNKPRDVYDMLEAIAKVVRQWQEGEGSLGTSWENAVAEHGYEFKNRIGDTTRSRWGEEYTFSYEGNRYLFEQHVTLGAKSAETCLSAHFLRDSDKLLLIVGWCGRHRRNTRT